MSPWSADVVQQAHHEKERHASDQERTIRRLRDRGTGTRRLCDRRGGIGRDGSGSTATAPSSAQRSGGLPPQRADETLLTGNVEAQVRKAALAGVSGGTIERVDTDADGNAAYEAHMVKSDGSRVTVYVNKSLDVVSVSSGRQP